MAGTRQPEWRIVARATEPDGTVVYDVYRDRERLAWGLHDRQTAARWVERLGGTVPERAAPRKQRQRAGATPRRAWWSERD